MGIFDKIKNALFEEEYVEVEEKPKAKREKSKKEVVKESKPIAKKVVLPDKEKEKREEYIEKVNEEKPIDEDFDIEPLTDKKENSEFKFPMIDDKEFNVSDDSYSSGKDEPEIVRVIEPELHYNDRKKEVREIKNSYQEKKDKHPYGINNDDKINVHEYGAYEKKEEKKSFKPSPIISPIYGVLDKNYKKEEIIPKREVRLTSSYARENLNVDDVRNKAYGTLSDDIAREIKEDVKYEYEEDDTIPEEVNLLVDLSSEDEKPQVQEITMGDAEEYFQDLGLEYNIDYKDISKEKATGRRSKDSYDDIEESTEEIPSDYEKEATEVKEDAKEDSTNKDIADIDADDNLFDLIDSMYEEEK